MSTVTTRSSASLGTLLKAGAIAGLAAGIVNVVVFFVAKAAGVPFEVSMAGTKTSVIFLQPLLSSVVGAVLGAVALWLLAKVDRGVTIWSVVAVVFVIAYSAYAFSAATATSTGIMLTIMHFVVLAAAWVRLLPAARAS